MEIVNILKFYLQYDEEGIKRVYVPAIIAVKEGEIARSRHASYVRLYEEAAQRKDWEEKKRGT